MIFDEGHEEWKFTSCNELIKKMHREKPMITKQMLISGFPQKCSRIIDQALTYIETGRPHEARRLLVRLNLKIKDQMEEAERREKWQWKAKCD